VITDYLIELLDELPLPRRRRRRIVAEVEDHLACSAAELHASGMDIDLVEREAVRRFGPARDIAGAFVEHEAARGGARVARAAGVFGVVAAGLILGPAGRRLTPGPFPVGLIGFVLAQVALVAGGLTVLRGLRAGPEGGPHGPRLALILRGAVVVVTCSGITLAYDVVTALAGSRVSLKGWIAVGALAAGTAGTAIMLALGWRRAALARPHGAAPGTAGDDALADLEAVASLAIAWLRRRLPVLHRPLDRLTATARTFTVWPSLRVQPWRFALVAAIAAGIAIAAGHGVTEGISAHHVIGALAAAAVITAVEASAALTGFVILGRFLGIRVRG
jgi:hypothetical protein